MFSPNFRCGKGVQITSVCVFFGDAHFRWFSSVFQYYHNFVCSKRSSEELVIWRSLLVHKSFCSELNKFKGSVFLDGNSYCCWPHLNPSQSRGGGDKGSNSCTLLAIVSRSYLPWFNGRELKVLFFTIEFDIKLPDIVRNSYNYNSLLILASA